MPPPFDAGEDDMRQWLAELQDIAAQEAARSRSRARQLRDQAAEEATFVGILQSLAERREEVAITQRSGRIAHGRIITVGGDFVAVRAGDRAVFVRLEEVCVVQPRTGARPAPPAGTSSSSRLAWIVSELAGTKEEVLVVLAGRPVSGEVIAAGADVFTFRPGERDSVPLVVPYRSVSELSLPLSSLTGAG